MSWSWRDSGTTRIAALVVGACIILALGALALWRLPFGEITYSTQFELPASSTLPTRVEEKPLVTHIATPAQVKAIYMSSWAAGSAKFRTHLFDLVDTTEINAVVIDIKDYTGRLSFHVDDPDLVALGVAQNRIPDIKELISKLHDKNVYVIGRISSFQDSFLINIHPEWAVKTVAGGVWGDYKGVKWLDAGATPVWDYLVKIGKQSYEYGFDELNFDYIRYPSDGNMKDTAYSWSNGRTRREVMKSFFAYLREQFDGTGIVISADLFGLTTSASDDLGIGQYLADALPYFDYIAPMVYPSHYAKGFNGYAKPAEHPYEVIKYAMDHASARASAASTTPEKIRPWLQDFDLGADYTPAMVRAQIQATYDAGVTSWMLWNAGSVYQKSALAPKGQEWPEPTATSTPH